MKGDYSTLTPEQWCERWRALRAQMYPGATFEPACYRCAGAGHYEGRPCEVCEMFMRTVTRVAPTVRCKICQDSGWVRAAPGACHDHPLYGQSTPCDCLRAVGDTSSAFVRALLAQADVPAAFRGYTLESFMELPELTESQALAALKCAAWARESVRWSEQNSGLRGMVLSGSVGVGKTSMGVAAAATMAECRWRAVGMPRFANWLRWVAAMEHGWKQPDGLTMQQITDYARTPVLVLDDFGTDGKQAAARKTLELAELVWEARSTLGDPWTLVTTNLPNWAAMEAEFGPRVTSRMQGQLLWVTVTGPDMRKPAEDPGAS